eukprot:765489-Hanusia_phi.AAC.7
MKGKKSNQEVFAKNSSRKAEYDALKEENEKLKRLLQEKNNTSKKRERDEEKAEPESERKATKKKSNNAAKQEPRKPDAKNSKSKAPSSSNANFMKMIEEQGLLDGGKGMEDALERDKKEVEELMQKLGPSWKSELQEDGLADFFDSLDHLDENSGAEDEEKEPKPKKAKAVVKSASKSKTKK